MSANHGRAGAPELDHGIGFVKSARLLLADTEPLYGDNFLLRPGDEPHLDFLKFFRDELDGLPFDGQVGEAILMRRDGRQVIGSLVEFLGSQASRLEDGQPWDGKLVENLEVLTVNSGLMEVFKNIILPEHRQSGIGYSVDLSAVHRDGARSFSGVKINRYGIDGESSSFRGSEDGSLELVARSGELYVDLIEGAFTGLRGSLPSSA